MNSRKEFIGPVNIGNPIEFTILELAQKIVKITGSSSKVVIKPLPEDDPLKRQPNITLARKEFEWEPKVNLIDGLVKTIGYFDSLISFK